MANGSFYFQKQAMLRIIFQNISRYGTDPEVDRRDEQTKAALVTLTHA